MINLKFHLHCNARKAFWTALCLLLGHGPARAWFEYRDDHQVDHQLGEHKPLVRQAGRAGDTLAAPHDGGGEHKPLVWQASPPGPRRPGLAEPDPQAPAGPREQQLIRQQPQTAFTPRKAQALRHTPQAPDSCPPGVQQIGRGGAFPAAGFGREVPLPIALKMLLPADWQLQLHEAAPGAALSWQSGQDWLEVLETLAPAQCIQVNWPQRSIRVYAKERAGTGRRTADAAGPDSPDTGPDTGAPERQTQKTLRVWKLQNKHSLREILARWSEQANWQLVWDAHNDYRIEAHSSYVGDYRDAVAQLLEDLAQSGLPLGAEFYTGNRVLRVRQVR